MFITADLLLNFQRCSRRAFLDRHGNAEQKDPPNDYLLKLIQDSAENRRQVLATQEEPRQPKYKSGDWSRGAEETLKLMQSGAERIYQPVLLAEEENITLVATPDLLVKRPGNSIFGDWIYVPNEIKLSKRPKQEYQVILAYFVRVLAAVQGAWAEEAWLILKERGVFAIDLWEVVPRMETILEKCIQAVVGQQEPEVFISRSRCSLCHWFSHCYAIAKSSNHLSLLPGVTQSRYLQLQALNITTLEALAEISPAQLEPLQGFGSETARKLVRQARSTLDNVALLGESLAAHTVGKRSFMIPKIPTVPIELYFDIEAEPSLELVYLHGVLVVDRIKQTETFHALLAETPEAESIAWQQLLDLLWAHPTAPIFHFCPYEVQTLERLGKQFETPEDLIKPLRARCIDLHDYVTQTVTLPVESYALKHIARWVGFDWRDSSANGAQSIYWYAQWLATGDRTYLDSILVYNEDDCRATHQVKEWLVNFLEAATADDLGYAV